jgi:putative PIN family toxin of toxin-antitoxin system
MISAVFDCVVYVQAAINDQGPAAACLKLVEDGHAKLFASPSILAEIRDTLSQKKLRLRFPRLTDELIDLLLQRIGQIAELLDGVPSVFSLPRDPDDAEYVNLSLAAQATFLVSRDKDLLSLMDEDGFCKAYPQLTILDPVAFLARVRTA